MGRRAHSSHDFANAMRLKPGGILPPGHRIEHVVDSLRIWRRQQELRELWSNRPQPVAVPFQRIVERCLVQTRDETFAGLDAIRPEREVAAAWLELIISRLMQMAMGEREDEEAGKVDDNHFKAIEQIRKFTDQLCRLRGL